MNLSLVHKRLLKKGFGLPTFPRECILSNSIITDSHCLFTFLLSLCSLLTVCLRTPFSSSFSWSSYFFFLTFSVTNGETWEFLRVRDERETESCERETEIREWDLWPSEKWCQENGVCIGFRPEIRTGPKQKNKKEKKQKLLGFRSYNTSFSVTYWLAHVAVVVFVTTLLVVLVTHFSDLLHLFLLLSQTIKRFFLLSFFVVPFSISV